MEKFIFGRRKVIISNKTYINVCFRDCETGQKHSALGGGHDDSIVSCVAWNPHATQIVSGDRSNRIAVWE